MFENKKIFILGMARSGYEVAKFLSKYNNKILITDIKMQDKDKMEELSNLGINVIITDNPLDLFNNSFDFVVKNPGIKLDHPLVLKAQELNIPVVNEVEVAYHFLPKNISIIGITGSNGKTTTTTLIYEFLKEGNYPVHLGGNIGIPLSNLVDNVKENDILVLEISGHQLHDMYDFKTNVSVMTNLSEVHIDHFKTYENYIKNKCKIFNNHTSNDLAILNLDNKDVYNNTKNIKSSKLFFSSTKDADICIKSGFIYYKNEKIVNISDIRLKGVHNLENIMCAIGATKKFGISNESINNVLSKFAGVEHRIEFVDKINGREFYNDSKATNVKSTQIALSSFDCPTILLLGGLDRGHSFDELKDYLTHVKYIVCYGETKNRIKEFANKVNVDCTIVDTLEEAVKFSYEISESGDVILLSPACASWDQYDSFEKRGEEFKRVVGELK